MKPSLSIQLYSLRDLSGIEKILDTAKQSGFQFVELVGSHLADADKVRQALDSRGLRASSSHVSMIALRERFDVVINACHTLGLTQLFMPAVPQNERAFLEPYWTMVGRELGQMSWRAADQGIELGYHNHDWELKTQTDGRTALDCLFTGAGHSPLKWQSDVAWLIRCGANPMELMDRYRDRLTSVHAKDIAPIGQNMDEDGWADVGLGTLDWKNELAAFSISKGARWLVAEHDKPNDPERFARNSFNFLNSLWLTL